ncbi:13093_t:CDS:1, partial [Dentiscutata erythropus]
SCTSESEENKTDISKKLDHKDGSKNRSWVWKYFKSEEVAEVIKERSDRINVKTTYCTCLVSNDSDKNCDAQLKVVGG